MRQFAELLRNRTFSISPRFQSRRCLASPDLLDDADSRAGSDRGHEKTPLALYTDAISKMPHAHLPVYHLLEQLRADRAQRRRVRHPQWLTDFIENAAELFEPIKGIGRVGYETWPDERGWNLRLFLGREEQMGGATDGRRQPVPFYLDLRNLARLLDEVTGIHFEADHPKLADDETISDSDSALEAKAVVRGRFGGEFLTVEITAWAPPDAPPGFWRMRDGRRELPR